MSQKWKIILFRNAEEKNLSQFSKNYKTFYPKICHWSSKKYGFGSGIRDPGSGIREKPIPDPGSPDPKHWWPCLCKNWWKLEGPVDGLGHQVGRVLSFFSNRRNWDSPTPSPAGVCAPYPFGSGGRGTLACGNGCGVVLIPTRGHTLWYSLYLRFVF